MGSTGSQHILRTPRRYCNSMEVTATIARFFGARSVLRRIALLTLAIWCVLAAFPALPPQTRLGLDPSWVLGINLAHAQGLEMGRDLVWPYGPLAYLSIPSEEEKRQEVETQMAALVAPGAPVSVLIEYGLSEVLVERLVLTGIGTIEQL